jgi:hypothetical protein
MTPMTARPLIRTQYVHLIDDPADAAAPVALRLTISGPLDRAPVVFDVPFEPGEEVVHVLHADVGAGVWVATTERLIAIHATPLADRVDASAQSVAYGAVTEVRAVLDAPMACLAVATAGRVLDLLTTDRRKAAALTAWLRRQRPGDIPGAGAVAGRAPYGDSRSRTHASA